MIRAAADGFRCLQAKFDLMLSVCSAYMLDLRACGFGECSVLDLNFGAVLVAAILVRGRCCSEDRLVLIAGGSDDDSVLTLGFGFSSVWVVAVSAMC